MLKTPIRIPIINPVRSFFRGQDEGFLWNESLLGSDQLMDLKWNDNITASSGIISNWTDSIGGRVFLPPASGNPATLESDSVTFNGTDQRLSRTIGGEGAFYNVSGGVMYHFIVRVNSLDTGSGAWLFAESDNASNNSYNAVTRAGTAGFKNKVGLAIRNSTPTIILTNDDCVDSSVTDTFDNITDFNLVTVHDSGTLVKTWVNGALQLFTKSYGRLGSLTLNRQTIGGITRPTANLYYSGGYKRIMVTKPLSDSTLQKLHGAMMWRENLQNRLVNTHPYKYQPPYV